MPASKAQQAITAERRAKALALKVAGANYEAIANQLGYAGRAAAFKDIQRALEQRKQDLDAQVVHTVTLELEKLETMERAAWGVLRREHVVVSHGRVIRDESGKAMKDDEPILRAIDRLQRISESRRKLLGTDAPTRLRAEVRNVDAIDAEIERLVEELAGRGEGAPAPPPEDGDRQTQAT